MGVGLYNPHHGVTARGAPSTWRLGIAGLVVGGYEGRMTTTPRTPSYAGYRFPAEVISYAVDVYLRFR